MAMTPEDRASTLIERHGFIYSADIIADAIRDAVADEREAWAHLIAAAPDLLASLRALVAWADAGMPFHAPDESIFPAARAAILKATQDDGPRAASPNAVRPA